MPQRPASILLIFPVHTAGGGRALWAKISHKVDCAIMEDFFVLNKIPLHMTVMMSLLTKHAEANISYICYNKDRWRFLTLH